MKIHIVQKGDTLWKIAKKYGADFEELKKMNSQLSNPDLIMPGMKIKVPTGGVPVKKETQVNFGSKKEMPIQKEAPKVQHPFAKEKPKSVIDVEDIKPAEKPAKKPAEKPAEKAKEKAIKPYVPPVPEMKQPKYPEMDINNYYNMNISMMPNQPQVPPKPTNVFPNMMKPIEEVKGKEKPKKEAPSKVSPAKKEAPSKVSPAKKEEAPKEMENKPNMPNMNMGQMPNIPNNVAGAEENKMPQMVAPAYQQPPYMMPVSPVMPGTGLCYPCAPFPHYPAAMPYGHGMPNMPFPSQVSPAEYDDDDDMDYDNAPHMMQPNMPQMVAPAYSPAPAYPFMPYHPGCFYPVSPVMPGTGLHQPQVMGTYNNMPPGVMGAYENNMPQGVMGAYENNMPQGVMGAYENNMPQGVMGAYENNMPHGVMGAYENNMPHAVSPEMDDDDCGCGGPPQGTMPYYRGYPMMPSYGQPYYGQPYYGGPQGFDQQQGQMFARPNTDDDGEED
ncbi:SafA/ExsA family spore coat assembly protein [Metabacillus arenae]|uniref:SafA/ExsA family spore coat assembly protein n=1 Tax=Metabacillus arenae TaxID=2771434 RepID=A0A926NGP1_9BACI|nr:SafA/ExsA family spore coat assembly protein [Metabacillus arenae]MBD1381219.1 SafA/ExsA family spore coat assembly protein [Metabacillus arenae]